MILRDAKLDKVTSCQTRIPRFYFAGFRQPKELTHQHVNHQPCTLYVGLASSKALERHACNYQSEQSARQIVG
jgi:hypothetical protein